MGLFCGESAAFHQTTASFRSTTDGSDSAIRMIVHPRTRSGKPAVFNWTARSNPTGLPLASSVRLRT